MKRQSVARRTAVLLATSVLLFAAQARGQGAEDMVRKVIATYPPATFAPEIRSSPEGAGSVSNVVFKPAGDGPFPAVVLVHTCGGNGELHMRLHARELLDAGMVVLLQDSFAPRGKRNCGIQNSEGITFLAGVIDAYAALGHLRNLPFVDKDHVYLAGYSWGGFVATLMGSPRLAELMKAPGRYRATVANYSSCSGGKGPLVSEATDRPLLMLLGEKDDETPPSTCFPLLEQYKAKGLPLSWHVYPGTTHGWDKQGQASYGYFYNADVAKDATRRMLEFFAQNK
jgi:dienelactone hydrolase